MWARELNCSAKICEGTRILRGGTALFAPPPPLATALGQK